MIDLRVATQQIDVLVSIVSVISIPIPANYYQNSDSLVARLSLVYVLSKDDQNYAFLFF